MATVRKILLRAIRDVRITSQRSWNCPFRGHSIITPSLGFFDLFLGACCHCYFAYRKKNSIENFIVRDLYKRKKKQNACKKHNILQHNLYFGAKRIPLFPQRPLLTSSRVFPYYQGDFTIFRKGNFLKHTPDLKNL